MMHFGVGGRVPSHAILLKGGGRHRGGGVLPWHGSPPPPPMRIGAGLDSDAGRAGQTYPLDQSLLLGWSLCSCWLLCSTVWRHRRGWGKAQVRGRGVDRMRMGMHWEQVGSSGAQVKAWTVRDSKSQGVPSAQRACGAPTGGARSHYVLLF